MGVIYLVRHGQASFGADDYDELSDLGREQARHLGQWIADCGQRIPAVVTGTHRRHRQSAEACSVACRAADRETWQEDAGFNEFDHHQVLERHRPEFAGAGALNDFLARAANPHRAFQQVFGEAVSRWTSGEHDGDYTEPFAAFRRRVTTALRRLPEAAGDAPDVWVFTSGGAISAIVQELLAIPDGRIFELNWTLVNTGVTKIIHRPGRASLSYVNSYAHLERLKRPELITYR
jgi:broad specificity phosphatase PhoE